MNSNSLDNKNEWVLHNRILSLSYDAVGGVLSCIKHVSSPVNPLNFRLERPDQPNTLYKGHFICAPRWGDPTAGEKVAGAIKHGDIGINEWELDTCTDNEIRMTGYSEVDQIRIHRITRLEAGSSVCSITETITNTSSVYRPLNLIQHPTLASPFLNPATDIFCSGQLIDFMEGTKPIDNIYSYSLNPTETGWIVAADQKSGLLLGYCWKSTDFPWIHRWVHEIENKIVYCGLEFGTAAVHLSWEEQQTFNKSIFQGRPSCFYLDPLASRTFHYFLFMTELPNGCNTIEKIEIHNDHLHIVGNGKPIPLSI